jgi:hypothetical protein
MEENEIGIVISAKKTKLNKIMFFCLFLCRVEESDQGCWISSSVYVLLRFVEWASSRFGPTCYRFTQNEVTQKRLENRSRISFPFSFFRGPTSKWSTSRKEDFNDELDVAFCEFDLNMNNLQI